MCMAIGRKYLLTTSHRGGVMSRIGIRAISDRGWTHGTRSWRGSPVSRHVEEPSSAIRYLGLRERARILGPCRSRLLPACLRSRGGLLRLGHRQQSRTLLTRSSARGLPRWLRESSAPSERCGVGRSSLRWRLHFDYHYGRRLPPLRIDGADGETDRTKGRRWCQSGSRHRSKAG
jgi:hypothetical protein